MRDKDVRNALHSNLLSHYHNDPDTLVIDELNICQGVSRADIVVINGLIHGYEIKSKKDNLSRLPEQISCYSKVMDKATLVVDESHYDKAKEILPDWWGIKVVSLVNGGVSIESCREEVRNHTFEPLALAQFLWKDELLAILEDRNALKGFKSKPRPALWKRLTEVLTVKELQDVVRNTLKVRINWRVD